MTEFDEIEEGMEDITEALEGAGYVEDEESEESDSSKPELPGPLSVLTELHGTGKSLESYRDSPIAQAIGSEDSQGALHIARGIDGLSPLGAMHPLMDIAVGIILLRVEASAKADSEGIDFGENVEEDEDIPDWGAMP